MSQKILVITTRPLEVNVSSSIRKIATIRSLIDAGANVTVISTEIPKDSPQYNNQVNIENINRITLKTGIFYNSGVAKLNDYKKKKSIKRKLKNIARNIYYRINVYDPLKSCIKYIDTIKDELDKKYNIIISISDPKSSHLLALALLKKRVTSCDKYIQIWGDPMYLDITNKSIVPKYIIKREEQKLLKRPDKIYYVSPLTMEEEKKLFPEYAHKMDVLFPTYEKESIYEPVTKIKKIGYFGDYNSNIRDIRPLYNAIKNSNYELIIFGNSDLELESTKNIKVNGRIPFEKVKEFEEKVDLLVHISNKTGTQIPAKIYQYMGTNKPILFILDGPKELLKKVFSPFNRVIFCENNQQDILRSIEEFNSGDINIELKPIENFKNKSCAKKILEKV